MNVTFLRLPIPIASSATCFDIRINLFIFIFPHSRSSLHIEKFTNNFVKTRVKINIKKRSRLRSLIFSYRFEKETIARYSLFIYSLIHLFRNADDIDNEQKNYI